MGEEKLETRLVIYEPIKPRPTGEIEMEEPYIKKVVKVEGLYDGRFNDHTCPGCAASTVTCKKESCGDDFAR